MTVELWSSPCANWAADIVGAVQIATRECYGLLAMLLTSREIYLVELE